MERNLSMPRRKPAFLAAAIILASSSLACASSLQSFPVQGSGVHRFSDAIEHSRQPTGTGEIVRSTDIVELSGDIEGLILYHPVSLFDYQNMTLVNTGHQVFSGTVAGSEPILILDDEFRFEVDLATGQTVGEVYLERTLAGTKHRCELTVTGTGLLPNGDATFGYTGTCERRGRGRPGDRLGMKRGR
jgi:hypothetical protein